MFNREYTMLGVTEIILIFFSILLVVATQFAAKFRLKWLWSVPASLSVAALLTGPDCGSTVLLSCAMVFAYLFVLSHRSQRHAACQ